MVNKEGSIHIFVEDTGKIIQNYHGSVILINKETGLPIKGQIRGHHKVQLGGPPPSGQRIYRLVNPNPEMDETQTLVFSTLKKEGIDEIGFIRTYAKCMKVVIISQDNKVEGIDPVLLWNQAIEIIGEEKCKFYGWYKNNVEDWYLGANDELLADATTPCIALRRLRAAGRIANMMPLADGREFVDVVREMLVDTFHKMAKGAVDYDQNSRTQSRSLK